jgi:hypothetical protein
VKPLSRGFLSVLISLFLLLAGCQDQEGPETSKGKSAVIEKKEPVVVTQLKGEDAEEPFIFSYSQNIIENKNADDVNAWLTNVRNDGINNTNVNTFGTEDGYLYFYAEGYKDGVVTYQTELKNGEPFSSLIGNFKKGNEDDNVLIEVKYNPSLCCDGTIIMDSYNEE